MKIINPEELLIDKVVDLFASFPEEEEICFFHLLRETVSVNNLELPDEKDLWQMYDKFLKECKKRKIKVVFVDYNGAKIGMPYHSGFWRTSKPLITKVIYNDSYRCWGVLSELSKTYTIFERHKITYCKEPLRGVSNKNNCSIKISYDPTYNRYGDECNYKKDEYDFDIICKKANIIANSPTINNHICDATPSSIVICYDNGKKKVITNSEAFEEESFIVEMVDRFMPDSFQRAAFNEMPLLFDGVNAKNK